MFRPSDDGQGWIHYLECSQPDNRGYNRMKGDCLRIQSVVMDAKRSLMAAAMRGWHLHLAALIPHRAAAGLLFGIHFRAGNHAGHRRSQARHQQQNQHTELAKKTHCLYQINTSRAADLRA